MKNPTALQDWTLEIIVSILRRGAFEPDSFDFKEALPHSKNPADKLHLRKSLTAFANSGGGFLIYGVKDDRTLSAEDRLVGVPSSFELPREFGNYPAQCEPSVEWRMLPAPIPLIDGNRVLHVFEILSTWRRPHAVFYENAAYFMKRTNKGNEDMSYAEIKNAFQEAEFRRSGLSLLISELGHMRSVAQEMLTEADKLNDLAASPDYPWSWSIRYSTTLLDTVLGNVFSFLAADPALWSLLCTTREKARASNALSEAISSAVFFRQNERVAILDTRVRQHLVCAREIVRASKEAEERIEKLL